MSFRQLYENVQDHQSDRIKTSWIRDQIIALTRINGVKEQWTGVLNPEIIRGFYIEGPLGPPVPLDNNEVLIVLARSLSKEMRRMVYTKELMHAFDTDSERANTPEKYDTQVEKFSDPTAPMSDQFRAEQKAFWRALAVLCKADARANFRDQLSKNETTLEIVAAQIKLPVNFVREMMRDKFEEYIAGIMD
ncbi:hypothetical protein [Hyphobacterium indicum]|uniref:hypothetical protein n=1 Tax=Hyphobacterium indicum TaxID=2162714 RepID=UPI000D654724|nr:hypothetical protein [Hyphobacterium indicum]